MSSNRFLALAGIPDTAPASAPASGPASGMDGVVDRIAAIEGTGQNPRSSSHGVGQFTDGTLLATYRRHYGQNGMSDAQVLGLKSDPAAMRSMLGMLTQDNAGALTAAGHDATPGNVYLAHHFGPAGAHAILSADPATPAARLLTAAAMRANPDLAGKTTGQLVAGSYGLMGDAGGGGSEAPPLVGIDSTPPLVGSDRPSDDGSNRFLMLAGHTDSGMPATTPAQPAAASPAPSARAGSGWLDRVGETITDGLHRDNDVAVGVMRGITDLAGTIGNYHAKHAAWVGTIDLEDDLADDVTAALAQLPPAPQQPAADERDFRDMTVREWMAIEQTPDRKVLWAAYERDKARWTADQEEVRSRILAPAKARYDAAYARYAAALNVLTSHPVTALGQLAEKIGIIIAEYENSDVPPEYLAGVLADVRRLSGEVR